jgi:hypothetical protein
MIISSDRQWFLLAVSTLWCRKIFSRPKTGRRHQRPDARAKKKYRSVMVNSEKTNKSSIPKYDPDLVAVNKNANSAGRSMGWLLPGSLSAEKN